MYKKLCGLGQVRIKKIVPDPITHKISESNLSFYVKYRTKGKVLFLFFKSFLLVLTKL